MTHTYLTTTTIKRSQLPRTQESCTTVDDCELLIAPHHCNMSFSPLLCTSRQSSFGLRGPERSSAHSPAFRCHLQPVRSPFRFLSPGRSAPGSRYRRRSRHRDTGEGPAHADHRGGPGHGCRGGSDALPARELDANSTIHIAALPPPAGDPAAGEPSAPAASSPPGIAAPAAPCTGGGASAPAAAVPSARRDSCSLGGAFSELRREGSRLSGRPSPAVPGAEASVPICCLHAASSCRSSATARLRLASSDSWAGSSATPVADRLASSWLSLAVVP
eukprot:scaffold412_cov116-Isochrysis_galbana.AAC.4